MPRRIPKAAKISWIFGLLCLTTLVCGTVGAPPYTMSALRGMTERSSRKGRHRMRRAMKKTSPMGSFRSRAASRQLRPSKDVILREADQDEENRNGFRASYSNKPHDVANPFVGEKNIYELEEETEEKEFVDQDLGQVMDATTETKNESSQQVEERPAGDLLVGDDESPDSEAADMARSGAPKSGLKGARARPRGGGEHEGNDIEIEARKGGSKGESSVLDLHSESDATAEARGPESGSDGPKTKTSGRANGRENGRNKSKTKPKEASSYDGDSADNNSWDFETVQSSGTERNSGLAREYQAGESEIKPNASNAEPEPRQGDDESSTPDSKAGIDSSGFKPYQSPIFVAIDPESMGIAPDPTVFLAEAEKRYPSPRQEHPHLEFGPWEYEFSGQSQSEKDSPIEYPASPEGRGPEETAGDPELRFGGSSRNSGRVPELKANEDSAVKAEERTPVQLISDSASGTSTAQQILNPQPGYVQEKVDSPSYPTLPPVPFGEMQEITPEFLASLEAPASTMQPSPSPPQKSKGVKGERQGPPKEKKTKTKKAEPELKPKGRKGPKPEKPDPKQDPQPELKARKVDKADKEKPDKDKNAEKKAITNRDAAFPEGFPTKPEPMWGDGEFQPKISKVMKASSITSRNGGGDDEKLEGFIRQDPRFSKPYKQSVTDLQEPPSRAYARKPKPKQYLPKKPKAEAIMEEIRIAGKLKKSADDKGKKKGAGKL
jgi:hypothetical protein